ncbi:MAG: c-type cytochrome [Verrucomicrobiota bacterium]
MRARLLARAGLAAALALGATACGTGGISQGGDPARGKQLFTQKCGSCHTLADAGTQGKVGPNLDEAFAADRRQQVGNDSSIQQVVADQIKFAACVEPPTPEQKKKVPPPDNAAAPLVNAGNCMPRHLVTGEDVNAVAAYVASVAGRPVQGGGRGGGQITATSGKEIFASAGCSSCHTLKAANATGTVGPNLDQLKPPKSRVVTQVTNGGAAMPAFKGKLTKQQIDAVAQYVSSVAGK